MVFKIIEGVLVFCFRMGLAAFGRPFANIVLNYTPLGCKAQDYVAERAPNGRPTAVRTHSPELCISYDGKFRTMCPNDVRTTVGRPVQTHSPELHHPRVHFQNSRRVCGVSLQMC